MAYGVLLSVVAALGVYGILHIRFYQDLINVVPAYDPDQRVYQKHRALFGDDGGTFLFALAGDAVFSREALNAQYAFLEKYRQDTSIGAVTGPTHAYLLSAEHDSTRFRLKTVMTGPLKSDSEAAAVKKALLSQPFYEGLLYVDRGQTVLLMLTIRETVMASKGKHPLIKGLLTEAKQLAEEHGLEAHFAGLPYFRYYSMHKITGEFVLFIALAIVFSLIALWFFYRNTRALLAGFVLLLCTSLGTVGVIGVLDYPLNILNALLPPIVIIISLPPFIYMLGEYFRQCALLGDRHAAVVATLNKLGFVTLMIMGNTALGFLTLYFTEVSLLVEFGLIAFLGISLAYCIVIAFVPLALYGQGSLEIVQHERAATAGVGRMINGCVRVVQHRPGRVFLVTGVLIAGAIGGITLLEARFFVADDLPQSSDFYRDLQFVEQKFGGAMPVEIVLDTRRPGGAQRLSNLRLAEQLQRRLALHPEISRTVSLADVVKWSRQGYFGGEKAAYALPINDVLTDIRLYASRARTTGPDGQPRDRREADGGFFARGLTDSTNQHLRIVGLVQDIGSHKLPGLLERIQRDVDVVMGKRNVEVAVSGTTRIFLKTNDYLLRNLKWSLIATLLIIGLQIGLLFKSLRMVAVAFAANLVPLALTAGVMGLLDIPLKPSTALIFQLSFSIAIDDCIHYLAMYRRRLGEEAPGDAALSTLRITGKSIFFTSVVLFFGFIIFLPSGFGTVRFMGILTSLTLAFALLANLLLVPALLRLGMRRSAV